MIYLPINLNNKIDSIIVNNVQRQTVEEVVHTSQKTFIYKDKKEKKDNNSSGRHTKEKLHKFNSIVEAMDIGIRLEMDGENIVALDENGNIFRTYTSNDVMELLKNIEDMVGVFIDIKK